MGEKKKTALHLSLTFLIRRLMIDSAANTLSPTADSSMFTAVLPTVSLLNANVSRADLFFSSSPSHSEFPTDHNTPRQHGRQRKSFFFFTALLSNRSRWNLEKNAHWISRCYVLGLLSEGRSVCQGTFFRGGRGGAAFPARGE